MGCSYCDFERIGILADLLSRSYFQSIENHSSGAVRHAATNDSTARAQQQTENKVTGNGNATGNTVDGNGNVVGNDNKVSSPPAKETKKKPTPTQSAKPKTGEPTSQKSSNTVQGNDNVTGNVVTGSNNVVGNGNTIHYPTPKVTLDHRGNLQPKETPKVTRDESGYDIRVEYSVWNLGEYEIEPMAMVVTCIQLIPELASPDEAALSQLNMIQLLKAGFCTANTPLMNTIQPKADFGPIRAKRECFVAPSEITENLKNQRGSFTYGWERIMTIPLQLTLRVNNSTLRIAEPTTVQTFKAACVRKPMTGYTQ